MEYPHRLLVGAVALPAIVALGVLMGCAGNTTVAPVATTPPPTYGALFCQYQLAGGGTAIVSVLDSRMAGHPVWILAMNATEAYVNRICSNVAAGVGGSVGVPVSPPIASVGVVSVVPG